MMLFLTSCITLVGYNSGYKKLAPQEKAKVQVLNANRAISSLVNSDTIYQIKASQLADFLFQKDSVLVYFWAPHCPGASCYPISAVQELCDKKGHTLIVIGDYFDFDTVKAQTTTALNYPILAVNSAFYGTDRVYKYKDRFRADLLKQELSTLSSSERFSRYLFFNRGTLVKTISDPLTK